MAKVYFVRHQAHGILPSFAFGQPPTAKQQEAIARICAATHGAAHPKTKEPYWFKVVEVDVLGADADIAPPEPRSVSSSKADLPAPTVEGRGHVENPKP
jgi:hypothetical protein